MSSSSESSEDEEEAKKICQAIIPNDFLAALSSVLVPESESESKKNKFHIQGTETNHANNPPKSKRTDKNSEENDSPHGYFLTTTPEFRAHIEKHLSRTLDREIDAQIRDSVWSESNNDEKKKQRGIKLFSNVKTLCLGETVSPSHQGPKSRPKIIPRKHKLSSSSESDEEDKINSCIFTVHDIEHENKLLDDLSKSRVEISGQESKQEDNGAHSVDNDTDPSIKKKKKKKKKPLEKEDDSVNTTKDCDESIINCKKKMKKKKKKSESERENAIS